MQNRSSNKDWTSLAYSRWWIDDSFRGHRLITWSPPPRLPYQHHRLPALACHTSRQTTSSLQYSLDSVIKGHSTETLLLRLLSGIYGPSTVLNSLCWHFSIFTKNSFH